MLNDVMLVWRLLAMIQHCSCLNYFFYFERLSKIEVLSSIFEQFNTKYHSFVCNSVTFSKII